MSNKRQFRLASFVQNVIDDGWHVVISHFVPADKQKIR
jgi:hypothetical protein